MTAEEADSVEMARGVVLNVSSQLPHSVLGSP